MNRAIRPRRPARRRPNVETLESRGLLTVLAGGFNPTFGSNGSLIAPVLNSGTSSQAIASDTTLTAVETNGDVVLAGSYNDGGEGYFTIDVVNSDGVPVTSFGDNGQLNLPIGPTTTYTNGTAVPSASSLVVRPDGTIDLGGTLAGPTSSTNASYGVVQVTPEGTLDTTFGNQGFATLPSVAPDQDSYQNLSAMTLTSSGQIIVVGDANDSSDGIGTELVAARFNVDGTLDSTFGTGGVASIPISIDQTTDDEATAVALQPGGRIIVAGVASGGTTVSGSSPDYNLEDGLVVGLTTSGQLDTTFGNGGEVILPPDSDDPSALGNRSIQGMAVQINGQILLAGSDALLPAGSTTLPNATGDLLRLNANGSIDSTFGTAGIVNFADQFLPNSAVEQSNGLIVVPGTISNPTGATEYTGAVVRLESDGTLDPTFGSSATPGLDTFNDPSAEGLLKSAAITPNGQILLGGILATLNSADTAYVPNILAIEVYPIIPVESEPTADYDGLGKTDLSVYFPGSAEFVYQPSVGGADVVIPFGIAGTGQTIPAPGDYDGSGKTEIAAYLPSVGVYAYRPADGGPDVLEAFGIPGIGQSIPVPGDYFGTGVDDIAVYMPSIASFGIRNPNGGPDEIIPLGLPGAGQSIPASGDYFGTGQTDPAVYIPAYGEFAIREPNGTDDIIPFGIPGAGNTIPIPGDYDGSGRTELAVYLPKLGKFAYRPADGAADVIISFGTAGDGSIPAPGDYTGVGYDEIGIYDPNYASFAYHPAGGGADVIESFGLVGQAVTLPVAAPTSSNVTGHASPILSAESTSTADSTTITSTVKAASLVRVASTRPAQADPSKPTT